MLRLLSAGFAGALLLAAPIAEAQIVGPPAPRPGTASPDAARQTADEASYRIDLRKADQAIREGRESGRLSKQEAKGLRKEQRQIGSLAERYGSDGMSPREADELYMRSRVLESQARLPGKDKR
ncbi:hypothetical protein EDF57_103180 [Novosphingobium sp. PhB55]|uniref:hypothetical protein n=1 Tax=Novosphingobium sp. PhB55 TaxID=2485106 RepID=UPI0010663773|nr:hypothetical protein [Novosphingobium sp. PhB55]TDW65006.1 hypothetical protein EDF57_103180 [Novosphingobium sp. PhB55]